MLPLKYLSNFWGTFEMPLINCEINPSLIWLENYFIMAGAIDNQEQTFTMADVKLYVPVVTLSTEDNAKLLQQLKTGFKRTTNWKKYQSKPTLKT